MNRHRAAGVRMHLAAAVVHQLINPSQGRLLLAALFFALLLQIIFFSFDNFLLDKFFSFFT